MLNATGQLDNITVTGGQWSCLFENLGIRPVLSDIINNGLKTTKTDSEYTYKLFLMQGHFIAMN